MISQKPYEISADDLLEFNYCMGYRNLAVEATADLRTTLHLCSITERVTQYLKAEQK